MRCNLWSSDFASVYIVNFFFIVSECAAQDTEGIQTKMKHLFKL